MKELLYLEIPTPDIDAVRDWIQQSWRVNNCSKMLTPDGLRLVAFSDPSSASLPISENELSVFTWSVQRTTYLKVFRWGQQAIAGERQILNHLVREIRAQFPPTYPEPPALNLSGQSIFEALAPHYPKTVHFFEKMPQGEYDLNRAYWWEKRWRESVRNPQQPARVVFDSAATGKTADYDLIYLGGALGAIHAAVMAQLGWKVLLVERLPFGRMNREWNISRGEFQSLIDLGLFSAAEFERLIAREYRDGFNKFFDGNNPPHLKAKILHTPEVLNIAIDSEQLLLLCGEKLKSAGGTIWDETEFVRADIAPDGVTVHLRELAAGTEKVAIARLLVDAMGTASPIAWQRNGGRTFDSVCPTVGAIVSGFDRRIWDSKYGDVLNSHGDTSRGRQLIWELFPAAGDDLTIYLFHYHQVHSDNPGSLLEMYEDFFTILPEYRHCEMEALEWKKATFGYIPGHFSVGGRDRAVAFDRLLSIGDAASLQSPLVFTGFGSLVRNLSRLTTLLHIALQHDLLSSQHLEQIRAYQSNLAVTWLFSKGMMVPTGKILPPERVNAMLNTFFGLLANEPPEVADTFIKDRFNWMTFNSLALKAAMMNPRLIPWIWQQAGAKDFLRWLGSYFAFALDSLIAFVFAWLPNVLPRWQPWLERKNPALWLRLLSFSYSITAGLGQRYRSGVKVESSPLPARV